jgi:hypothetical protein
VAAARGPVRRRPRRSCARGDRAGPQRDPARAPTARYRPAARGRRPGGPCRGRRRRAGAARPGGHVQPHGRPPGPPARLAKTVRRRRLPSVAHPADRVAPPPGDPRARHPGRRGTEAAGGWPDWSSRCWCWPAAIPPPWRSASWTCSQ